MPDHPITPPDELMEQWLSDGQVESSVAKYIATQAARWGADEQLEMDATWVALQTSNQMSSKRLIAEMRPKPPSLKEQALAVVENSAVCDHLIPEHAAILRRALESLPD